MGHYINDFKFVTNPAPTRSDVINGMPLKRGQLADEAVLTYPNQGLVSLWKSDTAGFLDFGLLGFLLGFLADGLRLLWYLGGPEMVCYH